MRPRVIPRRLRGEKGQGTVEYLMMLASVAGMILTVGLLLKTLSERSMTQVSGQIMGALGGVSEPAPSGGAGAHEPTALSGIWGAFQSASAEPPTTGCKPDFASKGPGRSSCSSSKEQESQVIGLIDYTIDIGLL